MLYPYIQYTDSMAPSFVKFCQVYHAFARAHTSVYFAAILLLHEYTLHSYTTKYTLHYVYSHPGQQTAARGPTACHFRCLACVWHPRFLICCDLCSGRPSADPKSRSACHLYSCTAVQLYSCTTNTREHGSRAGLRSGRRSTGVNRRKQSGHSSHGSDA